MDFQKKFDTEDKCRNFLFELRFPNGFVYPHCGCSEYSVIKSRHLTSSALGSIAAVSIKISLKGSLWQLLTVIRWVMCKVYNHIKLYDAL